MVGHHRFYPSKTPDIAAIEAAERAGRELIAALKPFLPGARIEHRLISGEGFPDNCFVVSVPNKNANQIRNALADMLEAAYVEHDRRTGRVIGMVRNQVFLQAATVAECIERFGEPEHIVRVQQAWQKLSQPRAMAR